MVEFNHGLIRGLNSDKLAVKDLIYFMLTRELLNLDICWFINGLRDCFARNYSKLPQKAPHNWLSKPFSSLRSLNYHFLSHFHLIAPFCSSLFCSSSSPRYYRPFFPMKFSLAKFFVREILTWKLKSSTGKSLEAHLMSSVSGDENGAGVNELFER